MFSSPSRSPYLNPTTGTFTGEDISETVPSNSPEFTYAITGNYEWALHWDDGRLAMLLPAVSREQGRLLGKMEALGFDLRNEAHLHTLTEDVVKSSEIEGEKLPPDQVRNLMERGALKKDLGGGRSTSYSLGHE